MIPFELRDFETYIIGFSCGKDSVVTLLWALENLPKDRLRVIYHPVGDIDPPENKIYLPYIESKLGIEIEVVKAGDRLIPPLRNGKKRQAWQYATSFLEMVQARGMWPDWRNRYCTTYLKQWPCVLYARELPKPILLTGQRAQESRRRAKLPRFSGKRDWKQTRDGLPIYRPILDWSIDDVWQEIKQANLEPNSVYLRSSRCNCLICFQARRCEVLRACAIYPDVIEPAVNVEQEIGHLWRVDKSIANLFGQATAQMTLPGFGCC